MHRAYAKPLALRRLGLHKMGAALALASLGAIATSAGTARAQDSGSVPRGDAGAIKKPADDAPPSKPGERVPPRVLKYVPPEYPAEAKAAGLEAVVTLELDIDTTGHVTKASVVNPAGHGFDEAAVAAAKQLEFSPAKRANGDVAPARILYRYTFELEEKAPPDQGGAGGAGGNTAAPEAPAHSLRGVVLGVAEDATGAGGAAARPAGEDVPVAGAKVTITPKGGGAPLTLTTGADGSFDAGTLAAGEYDVRLEAPGYEPTTLAEAIADGEETTVKYRLFVAKGGIVVNVRGERPPREVVKRTLTRREIDRIPGTNGDALRSLQNLPGVARPPAILGLLLVRGSGPADTQTFIDGTPVPLIYHFGGLSSVVPTELLEKIDFYPGNFGAEYGRVMGGIVDVGLRKPKDDGYHGLIQSDLVDTRALVEGPIPFLENFTFIAAGRRSYLDAWLGPTLEAAGAGVTQAPVYWDYQFLVEHNSDKVGRLRVGFFGSDDRLELLVTDPAANEPALTGNVGLSTAFQRLQVLYDKDLGDSDHIKNVLALGQDDIGFSLGPIFFYLNVLSLNGRFEWSHTFSPAVKLNTGVDVFAGTANVNLRIPQPNARPGEPPNQPFSTRPFQDLKTSTGYAAPAFYAEAELEPAPGVRIVPGVRLDYLDVNGDFDFSPRISGRFDVVRAPLRSTIKAGVGIYHQPPQFQQVVDPIGNPKLESNRAIHYAVGYEQEITKNIDASVEGFVKQLDSQVVGSASTTGSSGIDYDNRGLGYVVGSEVLLRYKPDERFFGWVAYTLSRSIRQNGPGEPEYLVSFDQTHILTLLGSLKLGHGWEIGARFRLVSGNLIDPYVCNPAEAKCDPTRTNSLFHAPSGVYTPIPIGDNSERLPMFHALDLRVDKRWKFSAWELSTYLDVQNVYNNQNPEAVGYNFDYTARAYVNGLPILPSLGVRADF
ncbi:MAG TPA: TonB family protein [Polyangiaceae bacterium]|nr:TonB family protein [Polyangiaceae bacterium]